MNPLSPSKAGQDDPTGSRTFVDPVPSLILQLTHDKADERLTAISDLGRLGTLATDALPFLSKRLWDEDAQIRRAAARVIGQMGRAAIGPLQSALTHADKVVRRQAVWALGRLGEEAAAAIPALGTALMDSDHRTASGAAQALANIGALAVSAVPALIAALQNVNLVQCRLAAKALGEIGPLALPALLQQLEHPDFIVRREVAVAIGFMGMRAGSAVGPIIMRLQTLARLPKETTSSPEKDHDPTASTPIRPIVSEPGDDRLILIEALARIGPAASSARECLIATLNEPDRRISEAAARALLRIMGWN